MTDLKKVFITGGAGFLGINLIRYLLTRGFSVASFDIATFDYPERSAIAAVTGDIRNHQALRDAMRGWGGRRCSDAMPGRADTVSSSRDEMRRSHGRGRAYGMPRGRHTVPADTDSLRGRPWRRNANPVSGRSDAMPAYADAVFAGR